MFVAGGRRTYTYGAGDLIVRIGSRAISLRVLVADIEDTAILGLGFLSGVNAKIDLVQQQLVINGEKIYGCSEDGKSLSLWCVTRRVVTIEPHCETVIPIHLINCQAAAQSGSANQGLHLFEPCGARLEKKGLYVGSYLVSVGATGPVPVRILNNTDKTQTIGAQTVVAVAKPVTGVVELELPEVSEQCTPSEVEHPRGGRSLMETHYQIHSETSGTVALVS